MVCVTTPELLFYLKMAHNYRDLEPIVSSADLVIRRDSPDTPLECIDIPLDSVVINMISTKMVLYRKNTGAIYAGAIYARMRNHADIDGQDSIEYVIRKGDILGYALHATSGYCNDIVLDPAVSEETKAWHHKDSDYVFLHNTTGMLYKNNIYAYSLTNDAGDTVSTLANAFNICDYINDYRSITLITTPSLLDCGIRSELPFSYDRSIFQRKANKVMSFWRAPIYTTGDRKTISRYDALPMCIPRSYDDSKQVISQNAAKDTFIEPHKMFILDGKPRLFMYAKPIGYTINADIMGETPIDASSMPVFPDLSAEQSYRLYRFIITKLPKTGVFIYLRHHSTNIHI